MKNVKGPPSSQGRIVDSAYRCSDKVTWQRANLDKLLVSRGYSTDDELHRILAMKHTRATTEGMI